MAPTSEKTPNLDDLRDSKCAPIAMGILADAAAQLPVMTVLESKDFQEVTITVLRRVLEADTNLIMENPYIFQMITGALNGFKGAVQGCKTVAIDDTRYSVIAKKMMAILAGADLKFTALLPEDSEKMWAPVKEQLNTLFEEEKLTLLEVDYIMDNIFGSFNALRQIFNKNIEDATQRMEAKILKIEAMSDLTMKMLDDALTNPMD